MINKIMIAAMSLSMLVLCGTNVYADSISEEELVGKWLNYSSTFGEDEYVCRNNLDEYWEFEQDGSAAYIRDENTTTGKWYIDQDTVVVEMEEYEPRSMFVEDGFLKEYIDEDIFFFYTKKETVEFTDFKETEMVEDYFVTYPEEELIDVLNSGEILASGGITASGSHRYYFMHLNQSGFDSSSDYFGIYDYGTKTWPIELQEMDFTVDELRDVEYVGEGVFMLYNNSYESHYFSAPLGDYFAITFDIFGMAKNFQGGYSIGDLPDRQIGVLSVYGDVIQTGIMNGGVAYQCDKGFVIRQTEYGSDNTVALTMYFYDTKQAIVLDESYATKATEDTDYRMSENGLYVMNLMGMDGLPYYAMFDKAGSVLVPATLMDELDSEELKVDGKVLVDDEVCKITLVQEAYDSGERSMRNDDGYYIRLYLENKTDQDVMFTMYSSFLNDQYCFTNFSGIVSAGMEEEAILYWGPDASYWKLDSEKIYSAMLFWNISDPDRQEILDDVVFEAL